MAGGSQIIISSDGITIKTPGDSFNYYPDISPYLDFKVKKNTLYIIEMSGTASSGNWIKQRYNINIKNMSLIKK